ncbi:MAG TPA: carboxypeptidase regulatory-like domain-containing protein, partial [Pyrinomonadaceae bacterium]|nr:carboxypeptidase regulatory-like domain-containing protein [Pyrinomonadaceae bacterium]
MRNHLRHALVMLLAAAACVGLAGPRSFAQVAETAAQVSGQVTDPNGAPIAGATVVVTSPTTGDERRVQTNEDGIFTVSPLNPGIYTVTVEQTGFKRHVENGVTLNALDRRTLNVELAAGSVDEVVTVTSEQNVVQDSPTTQSLVSNAQIVELPLNNRNFIRLLEAGVPGVSSDLSDETGFGLTSVASISINGMRRNSVNYLVDGVSNTDVGSNITLLSTPTVDAIQEFKVLSSNFTAEIGRSGGGAVTIVTRGGTNEFHGTLYEFVRNDRFNANSYFNNRRGRNAAGQELAPVPKLRYNNFGGTIGGPVYLPRFGEGGRALYDGKDRTFFFFSEEVRRIIKGQADASATVPSLAQRGFGGANFDYSATLGSPLCRTSAGAITTTCTGGNTPVLVTDTAGNTIQARQAMIFRPSDGRAYAGNVIPRADVDPRAIALLDAYPLANNGANGFLFS